MAWVAASISCSTYDSYSPRLNKKKKIKVSLDNIHQTYIVHSVTDHNHDDLNKRHWEKDVRRVSLTSLPQMKSMEDKITRSEGCIVCTANKLQLKNNSPSLRKAVICKQARSVDSCVIIPGQTTPKKCHKSHSHSDFCLRDSTHRRRHSGSSNHSSDDDHTPSIDIVASHSSLKCGTNIKSWTVKVDVRPFTPKGEVMVCAEGQCVKIKAKMHHKQKGLAHIFSSGPKEIKRTLKFAGIIETSSLKTTTDKEGFLTIDLYETLPY